MTDMKLSPELAQWLDDFRARNGRSPRLLHLGNLANNAYLNAKLLNRAGLDCDVLCYDYYHIMSCPEWEDADYLGDIRSDNYPTWTEVDLRGFERPRWFAQGPILSCIDYLIAKREAATDLADRLWEQLRVERERACSQLRGEIAPVRPAGLFERLTAGHSLRVVIRKAIRKFWKIPRILVMEIPAVQRLSVALGSSPFIRNVKRVCDEFSLVFPDRTDRLQPSDFLTYGFSFPRWQELFRHYDLVAGYAIDGVYPMLVGRVPYVAYEHGTIRNIPFESTPQGRLCALTYRLANEVFITNCDNRVAAEKLGLPRYRFVPHPINEDVHPTADSVGIRKSLREKLGSEFIVFHPSRQHWSTQRDTNWDKGNDILIEGFARFVHEVCPRAGAVFVEWGQTIAQSRELIAKLGITDRVLWIPPQPTPRLNAYIRASEVLADQFCIGAFGSTMPRGLMMGTPNLIYLDERQHEWCMPEMPPVANVRTPEGVFTALKRLYEEPGYATALAKSGQEWYAKYHSSRVVADAFTMAVKENTGQ